MSGRSVFLVAYDIRNPKRLRRIHKTLRGYGDALQFSVFQCKLSAAKKQLLITDVSEIIHHAEDRVLIAELGPEEGRGGRACQILGRQEMPPDRGPVIL